MEKHGKIHSGIFTPDKKVTIIPFGNNSYARNKNPTDSSFTSLRIETSRMHKKLLPYFQSKGKKSDPSSIFVEPNRVPTEVDYSTEVDPIPTLYELNNMGGAEKDVSGIIEVKRY